MRPIRSYKCDIFSGDETKEYLPVASHFEAFTNIFCYYNTFFHLTHRMRGINENSIYCMLWGLVQFGNDRFMLWRHVSKSTIVDASHFKNIFHCYLNRSDFLNFSRKFKQFNTVKWMEMKSICVGKKRRNTSEYIFWDAGRTFPFW